MTNASIVLLSDETKKGPFAFYPTAKIGDFGMAIDTHRGDTWNPDSYTRAGTKGYHAPVSILFCAHLLNATNFSLRSNLVSGNYHL